MAAVPRFLTITIRNAGFPGVMRGTLDCRAVTISDEMAIAAALELARCAGERGLREDAILPTMDDLDIVPRIAAATALKAQEQGLARVIRSRDEWFNRPRRACGNHAGLPMR